MRKREEERREAIKRVNTFLDCPSEVIRAYEYARECHRGQTRLDGEGYINHPVRVAEAVARYAEEELNLSEARTAIIAALLHDIVEDTTATVGDVSRLFGGEVARVVLALSHEDEEEPDEVYLARVTAGGPLAVLVKRCDKLDNVRSLSRAPEGFRDRKKAETLTALPLWQAMDPVGAVLIRSALAKV